MPPTKRIKDIFKEFKTSEKGLTKKQARERLEKYGFNELKEKSKLSLITLFINQFKSLIVGILIIAIIISAFLGEKVNAIVIIIILLANAIIGFIQEYKADNAIKALKKLTALQALVIRDNKKIRISAKELVPGDLVILETGDKIPADLRLIETIDFYTNESSLTGESSPIKKTIENIEESKIIAEKKNMAFSSTTVTRGRGKGIVTSTGIETEIGKIAEFVTTIETDRTPLQIKLDEAGRYIVAITLIIAAVVFLTGLTKGIGMLEIFLASISLAVAAVPEGLPAVVTISLALGVKDMAKKHALVRKLPAVETLGGVTVIATDKTGTLTENEMTVKEIFTNNNLISVTGEGYDIEGEFFSKDFPYEKNKLKLLMKIAASCNDADLENGFGDPTELALLVAARKANIDKISRTGEMPFNSEKKYMVTFHSGNLVYSKGAPEVILSKCTHYYHEGRKKFLTGSVRKKILEANSNMTKKSLRVLAMAYSDHGKENKLTFVGLMGMMDPPREEVKESIQRCYDAGIKVIMITGDHKETAIAIGKEIGIKGRVITGEELDNLEDKEIKDAVIYARVNPEHKVRILNMLKKRGEVVAMTGDGVNDAPALKRADIGISMSMKGTEVAKEASDMILVDDNFSSIVNAVEEGRGIYNNIKKFIVYLLSSNIGEVLTIFLGIIFGLGLPLVATQILWINLITDGLPALALTKEPIEKDIMKQKPRKKKEKIISKNMSINMFLIGIIMAIGTLFMFHNYGRTMAFTTLVMFQLFNVFNSKSENGSVLPLLFNNSYLLWAVLSSILLQIIVLYTGLNTYFGVNPLTASNWVLVILVSSTVLIFVELRKLLFKNFI